MKSQKIALLLFSIIILGGCASGYKTINPASLTYQSTSKDKDVALDYKYNLLHRRYAKNEIKNNVRLVAVKVTNNSGKDLVFGKDIKLVYTNNAEITMMDDKQVYSKLKQGCAGYLLYLLLTPATLTTSSGSGQTSSMPIGYAIGPGLALGNIIAAGAANKNFNDELLKYNINGSVIKNGETVYGLVGIDADTFDAINVKVQ